MPIKKTKQLSKRARELAKKLQASPLFFINKMFGIVPERDNKKFIKGKHLSWQQHDILLSIEDAVAGKAPRRISVASGHGVGKGVDKNEILWLCNNNSIKPIKASDIKIGDYILGNEKPTKVLGVYPQPKQKAYKVSFDDGGSLITDAPHLWSVRGRQERRKKSSSWRTLSTQQIRELGVKRSNGIAQARQWEIPSMKVEGFIRNKWAYSIGVWIGDGCVKTEYYSKPNPSIAEHIESFGINVDKLKSGDVYAIRGLKQHCIVDSKHSLPPNFLSWDIDSRKQLLAGLVDTDGTIGKHNGNIEFGSIRKGLAEDTLTLIRSLGGKGRIRIKKEPKFTYKGEKCTGQKYYRVSFQTPFNPFIADNRNKSLWTKPQQRYLTRWIDSIKEEGEIESICFKVDAENELYIAGKDMIVTHNSSTLAWIVLWFLFCHKDAQIACTAPTATQMHDVLWKECKKWIDKMPEALQAKFDFTSSYIRITERPDTWFARAKTARKEAPEALAGIHGDNVLLLGDEASGIDSAIFNTAEGSLTDKNTLTILASNPTRLIGYFYDSHHGDKDSWQTHQFSCIESPLVDLAYVDRIKAKHGEDSDEYRIRVLGEFPNADAVDDKGYVPLLGEQDLHYCQDNGVIARPIMGIDPAGDGKNKTVWVIRDQFSARIVAREEISSVKGIAQKTMTLMAAYDVDQKDVIIDNFGAGANVAQELALSNLNLRVSAINVGNQPDDTERFINLRAELFWKTREWLRSGGELVRHDGFECLRNIRFRRNNSGRIQIKSKREMIADSIPSPDEADALSLTFFNAQEKQEAVTHHTLSEEEIDSLISIY